MRKQKMSALDVRAMKTICSNDLLSFRLANIYDVDNKVFIFKFQLSGSKQFLLVQPGNRFHITRWERDKNVLPSNLCMKLRKHLRSKRLEEFNQFGLDRVIELVFGTGENTFRLIIELFASGNLILTDINYRILIVSRRFSYSKDIIIVAKKQYPVEKFLKDSPVVDPTKAHTDDMGFPTSTSLELSVPAVERVLTWQIEKWRLGVLDTTIPEADETPQNMKSSKHQRSRNTSPEILDLLRSMLPFGSNPMLIHCLLEAGAAPSDVVKEENITQSAETLLKAIECAMQLIEKVSTVGVDSLKNPEIPSNYEVVDSNEAMKMNIPVPHGWIVLTNEKAANATDSEPAKEWKSFIYKEFTPLLFRTAANDASSAGEKVVQFPSFVECVDEYFSRSELKQLKVEEKLQETMAYSKPEAIVRDQERRIKALEDECDRLEGQANHIQGNKTLVEHAIGMLNKALSTGSDWKDIENYVKKERKDAHPIAAHIHSLNLEQNEITMILYPREDEMDNLDNEEDETPTPRMVPIDLTRSVFGNIERLHTKKKLLRVKLEKTKSAMTIVVKKAEDKVKKNQDKLAVGNTKTSPILFIRAKLWFEKFFWFITSENYLVLAGRNAEQNELLYRRHLEKNDIYVHADVYGAASCIVKNPLTNTPVPQQSLDEAGQMAICRSSAWVNKLITSAWWVFSTQVSKTAPAGEYLVSGGFMIRGKRNFLLPAKLEMGVGLLFYRAVDASQDYSLKGEIPSEVALQTSFEDSHIPEDEAVEGVEEEVDREMEGKLEDESDSPDSSKREYDSFINEADIRINISITSDKIGVNTVDKEEAESAEKAKEIIQASKPPSNELNTEESRFCASMLASNESSRKEQEVLRQSTDESVVINGSSPVTDDPEEEKSDETEGKTANTSLLLASPRLSGFSKHSRVHFEDLDCDLSDDDHPEKSGVSSSENMGSLINAFSNDEEVKGLLTVEPLDIAGSSPSDSQRSCYLEIKSGSSSSRRSSSLIRKARLSVDEAAPPVGFTEKSLPSPRELLSMHGDLMMNGADKEEELPETKDSPPFPDSHDKDFKQSRREAENLTKLAVAKTFEDTQKKSKSNDAINRANSKAEVVLPRGKREKLRRMKNRYKEQDADDREEALKLLGSKQMMLTANSDESKLHSSVSTPKKAVSKAYEDTKPKEALSNHRKLNFPIRSFVEDREQVSDPNRLTSSLPPLTASPTLGEPLKFVIPVCAPISALQNYKYTLKLLPGKMKRGEASQLCLKRFVLSSEDPTEKSYIKALKTDELVRSMPGSVSVLSNQPETKQGKNRKHV